MIQSIRRRAEDLGRLPVLSRIGAGVMVVAGVGDVVVHLVLGEGSVHQHGLGPEHVMHLLGITGMVLVLAGIAVFGVRRSIRSTGGTSHAHR